MHKFLNKVSFIIGGVASIIIGLLIAALPRELKDAADKQAHRQQEHQKGQIGKTTEKTGSISDMHKSIWLLLQNWPFLFIIMAGGFEGMILSSRLIKFTSIN